MRRKNFLIGALAALLTFITLSAFVHKPWGWHHRWHDRHYYDHDDDRNNDRSDSRSDKKSSANDSTTTY